MQLNIFIETAWYKFQFMIMIMIIIIIIIINQFGRNRKISNFGLAVLISLSVSQYGKVSVWDVPMKASLWVNNYI